MVGRSWGHERWASPLSIASSAVLKFPFLLSGVGDPWEALDRGWWDLIPISFALGVLQEFQGSMYESGGSVRKGTEPPSPLYQTPLSKSLPDHKPPDTQKVSWARVSTPHLVPPVECSHLTETEGMQQLSRTLKGKQ